MPTTDSEIVVTKGNTIMVRWLDVSLVGIARVEAITVAAARATGLVHYYGIVPDGAGLPPDDVRKRMQDALKVMHGTCETINLVFEGTGMKAAAARSIAASIFLISGNRKMHMHSSLDEALVKMQPHEAPQLAQHARDAGVV
jgi:hypothetical protein